jgi:hypothetical protein
VTFVETDLTVPYAYTLTAPESQAAR